MAKDYFAEFQSDFEKLKGTFGGMKEKITSISSTIDTIHSSYFTLSSSITGDLNWDDPMQKATEIRMTKTVDALKLIKDSVDDDVIPLIQKTLDTYFTTILQIKTKQKEYENALHMENQYEKKANDAETDWNRMKVDLNTTGDDRKKAESLFDFYSNKQDEYKAKRKALQSQLDSLIIQANNEKQSVKNSDTAFSLSNLSASLDIAVRDAEQASGNAATTGSENYYGYDFNVDIQRANDMLDARIALLEEEAKKYPVGSEEYNKLYAEVDRLRTLKYDLNDAISMSETFNDTEEDILEGKLAISNLLDQVFDVETGSINAATSDIISDHMSGESLGDDLSDLSKYVGYGSEWITEAEAPAILDRLEKYDSQAMSDYTNGLINYDEYLRRMEVSGLLHDKISASDTMGHLDASGERAASDYWVHENSIRFVKDMKEIRLPDGIDSKEVDSRITSDRSLGEVETDLREQLDQYSKSNDKSVMLTTVELASKVEEGVRTGTITPAEGRELVDLIKTANDTVYWDHSTPGMGDAIWDLDRNATKHSLNDLINDLEKSAN